MAKAITLEESFGSLEKIIDNLENGQLSLDESFKMYNEGIKLIKNCNIQLDKVEKQIIILDKSGEHDGI
ncbi:exodeoxyribonuclease VII small subunit [[Clostridium] fimetarium]|uniref:Exodeoxyribonuclease 7 small subunit n=1 Tax=[Clostridium] fimetarium TaxID=99656 RepID=A0A1I0RVK0_9FIRM|nr:exodeoxyribonuclease VII small subunit [[Clostridium] fimetarium]SEW45349.1 exodeoxyribonuclease VII small subunit [[Clostridium] fimetarium]